MKLLIAALLTIVSTIAEAKPKPFTFVVKAASGEDYLALFAATCEDDAWKTIQTWAEKTKFSEKILPEVQIKYDGKKLESNTDIKVDMNGEALTTTVDGKTVSGTLCEAVAQLVSDKKAKTALVDFLIPEARAQKYNTKDHTMTTGIATMVGFTGAGCALGAAGGSVIPVLGTAAGCGIGSVVGAIGGLVKVVRDDMNVEDNLDRLEMDLKNFLRRGFPQMKTCSKHAVQAVNGKRTINIARSSGGSTIQVREGSKLLYKTKMGFIEEELFQWCNSPARAGEFNAKIKAQHKRAISRLQVSDRSEPKSRAVR